MCVLNVFGINKYYSIILFSLMWLTCGLIVEMYYPIGFEWSLCGIPLLIKGATGYDHCVFVLQVLLCVRPAQSGFNKHCLLHLFPSNHMSGWNILKQFSKESGTNILYMHTQCKHNRQTLKIINIHIKQNVSFLKEIVHSLKLFQTCMSFFLLLNAKEHILKNVGNQTVAGSYWLP